MASTHLVHARCGLSSQLSRKAENGYGHVGSSSSSSSSTNWHCCSSSVDNSRGVNNSWKNQSLRAQTMNTTRGNVVLDRGSVIIRDEPDHLLVLVHGIMASPSDWTYVEAELKKRLGRNFLIYASSSNTFTKTFGGIDGAGKRLADEVTEVVQRTESLKKISFLAHSLGGLFTRYAISALYSTNASSNTLAGDLVATKNEKKQGVGSTKRGTIAGLEPINFITLATPHLGVRGRKQLPFLFGVTFLEKLAAPMAPFLIGRTGSQLFLTDGKPNRPPLLLRMTSDCEEGSFMSLANNSLSGSVSSTIWLNRKLNATKPPRLIIVLLALNRL